MAISPFKEYKAPENLTPVFSGSTATKRIDGFRQGTELTNEQHEVAGIVNISSGYRNQEIEQTEFGFGAKEIKSDPRFSEIIDKFDPRNFINKEAPFTPALLTNLAIWYTTEFSGVITTANSSSWTTHFIDQSKNGRDITQATDAFRPVYIRGSNKFNGYPVARFSVARTTRLAASTGAWTLVQPVTYYIVVRITATSGGDQMIFDGIDGGSRHALFSDGNGTNLSMYAGAVVAGSPAVSLIGSTRMICAIFNGANSELYVDDMNTDLMTGNPGTFNQDALCIGSDRGSSVSPLNGDVSEFVAYSSIHNFSTREKMKVYFKQKYKIGTPGI